MKTILALLILAGPAHGQGLFIKDNDRDGDGRLSWLEVKPLGWSQFTFELKDMDGDGTLSEDDLQRHAEWVRTPVLNGKILRAMDTDGDGKLQKTNDFWWWDSADFDRYDADKNGVLDGPELAKIPKAKDPRKVKAKSRSKIGKKLQKALAAP